jgi:hypothetical protein
MICRNNHYTVCFSSPKLNVQSLLEIPKTIYIYILSSKCYERISFIICHIVIVTLTMDDSQICINVNFYLHNSVGGLTDRQTVSRAKAM